jgi:hypothetical protein
VSQVVRITGVSHWYLAKSQESSFERNHKMPSRMTKKRLLSGHLSELSGLQGEKKSPTSFPPFLPFSWGGGSIRFWTQGLVFAEQVLYHFTPHPKS